MGHAVIGHVHLKVRDRQRSLDFYQGILGWEVTERLDGRLEFLSGGPARRELALMEVGPEAPPAPRRAVGLYHVAFEVPDCGTLAEVFQRLVRAGLPVSAVDHGISWALYAQDPGGNGLEVYGDTRATPMGRPRWNGQTRPLALDRLHAGTDHPPPHG